MGIASSPARMALTSSTSLPVLTSWRRSLRVYFQSLMGSFGSGSGSDVYEGWLDEHVGKALSRSHALDIAQSIRLSLGSKQEEALRQLGTEEQER